MNGFDVSKKFTTENFARYVAPILRDKFHAVEVHDTESLADEESKRLDCENCIDGYFVTSDGKKEYFASRIQRGFYPTFTVRKSRDTGSRAEYQRLCKLINGDEIYPKYFIQTYIETDGATVAITKTVELMEFIHKTNPPVRHTRHTERPTRASEFLHLRLDKVTTVRRSCPNSQNKKIRHVDGLKIIIANK